MRTGKSCASFFVRQFCCLLLIFVSIHLLLAQAGRGGISGIVADTTGAIIPGAAVTATNTATGTQLTTKATSSGLYSFISLAPGSYEISVSAQGFDTLVQKNVSVTLDQTTTLNLKLKVGSVSQVVTVTETTELVDTSNTTVGQLINAETIDRVPLLTRNVYDLVQLSSGVTPANGTPNSSSSQSIQSISAGRPNVDVSSYTINGAIVGSVYYMVDGSPLGIAENNAGAIMPALDLPEEAVDEVRVETQNTPASFQSGGAGVISVASKSGTDKFHGSAFGVFRPNIGAANDYFNKQNQVEQGIANTPPEFHRYQEGGSIGGPIYKKKLFFFGDFEATQQQLFAGESLVVPTAAERNGNFSALSDVDGNPITVYDPTKPDLGDGTRQPLSGNVVASPLAISQTFFSHMPKCNRSNIPGVDCESASDDLTPNYYYPGTDPTDFKKFDVRIDWAQSDKQRIFGRYSWDHHTQATVNAFGNEWDPNYAQNVTHAQNFLLADDIALNATTALSLRYSFTRHYENQGGDPRQDGFDITSVGFPSDLAAQENLKILPLILFGDNGSWVGGTANWNTFLYASQHHDANVSLTKSIGKHSLSAGFEYMKRFLNVGQPPAPSGAYGFDVTATDQTANSYVGGSDFASFELGIGMTPGNESAGYPSFSKDLFAAESNPYYAAFVEDTWHVTPRFTLTLGLRWDIFGGRTERHNRLEYFDPSVSTSVNGVNFTGAEVYVGNGHSRSPYETNMHDLGPRIGFSWQPTPHVVFNGGGGIYYGPSTQQVGSAGLDSDGFTTNTTWNATQWNYDPNTIAYDRGGFGNTVLLNPLSNPFPNGVLQPLSNTSGYGHNLGTALSTVLHHTPTPTTYNFNLGYQIELPHSFVLSAAYVGSRGIYIPLGAVDLNTLDLATIGKYGPELQSVFVPNQWKAIQDPTNANYGSDTVPLFVSLEQYPQYGDGNYGDGVTVNGDPGGFSNYHSLQTKINKRLTSHFTMLASFTWAKLMTNDGNPPLGFVGSHAGGPQDSKNMEFEHSVSPQDVKYQFTGEASYDLPIGKGRLVALSGLGNTLLGGWTLNGIYYRSTGIPLATPGTGDPLAPFAQRPNLSCNPGVGAPHTVTTWFSPDCFTLPSSPYVAGNAPAYLDMVRTQGANDLDMSIYKVFAFTDRFKWRVEFSAYNLANKPQYGAPNVYSVHDVNLCNPGDPNSNCSAKEDFGHIYGTVNQPRQLQFGTHFTF